MANHTPGPWLARELISGHWQVVQDDSAQQIAGVYATAGDSSNARLIAAAPDLLAALEGILEGGALDTTAPECDGYRAIVRAAIRKAKGE
jgi:hypothetical protein